MFSVDEKQFILNLARESIEYYFNNHRLLKIILSKVPEKLQAKQACFITLTINNNLRGCVGHTEPIQPLYLDVVENAVSAAFDDSRFSPLDIGEFDKVKIEVSILSTPTEIIFSSPGELLGKIRAGIDGVIIQNGENSATYLPQVWETFPDKIDFLNSLCEKAELSADAWKKTSTKIWVYSVEIF